MAGHEKSKLFAAAHPIGVDKAGNSQHKIISQPARETQVKFFTDIGDAVLAFIDNSIKKPTMVLKWIYDNRQLLAIGAVAIVVLWKK